MSNGITITVITDEGYWTAAKFEAAKVLARLNGGRATVTFTDSDGDEHSIIDIYSRHRAYGATQPAHVSWMSTSAQFTGADARAFAAAVTVAAEIAELADEIAAEQEQAAAVA